MSVRPTHTRRGTLNRLNADDVARAVARGDAASILIASEWPIYGRYGYGPATWIARWTLRTRAARFQTEPVGSIEIVPSLEARKLLPDLHERVAAAQPGEIAREAHRWDFELGITEYPGRPRWRGSIAIHRDASGTPDGYARYRGEESWEEGIPDNVMLVDELRAVSVEVEIDLWRFLAGMDLTATIRAETRRERELLIWYLADARAARATKLNDFLWLRPLDVARLLGERTYDRDGALVLEVLDTVGDAPGPAAGRYRLEVQGGAATCARTEDAPELTLDAQALGAARARWHAPRSTRPAPTGRPSTGRARSARQTCCCGPPIRPGARPGSELGGLGADPPGRRTGPRGACAPVGDRAERQEDAAARRDERGEPQVERHVPGVDRRADRGDVADEHARPQLVATEGPALRSIQPSPMLTMARPAWSTWSKTLAGASAKSPNRAGSMASTMATRPYSAP